MRCDPDTLTPIIKENGDYDLDIETNHISTWKVGFFFDILGIDTSI